MTARFELINGDLIIIRTTISLKSQLPILFVGVLFMQTVIIPVIILASTAYNIFSCRLEVTRKSITGYKGVFIQTAISFPIDRIESLTVSQGCIGKILNYGKLTVRGTGGNHFSVPFVDNPRSILEAIQSQLNQHYSLQDT